MNSINIAMYIAWSPEVKANPKASKAGYSMSNEKEFTGI